MVLKLSWIQGRPGRRRYDKAQNTGVAAVRCVTSIMSLNAPVWNAKFVNLGHVRKNPWFASRTYTMARDYSVNHSPRKG